MVNPDGQRERIGGSKFAVASPPHGFGAVFYRVGAEDDTSNTPAGVVGWVTVDDAKEGPPGHVHGGALTALVDEAMGAAAWHAGYRVLAANLNVNFKRPVPLGARLQLSGRVTGSDGRKVYTTGEITLPDGAVAVQATGLFVSAPAVVGMDGFNPFLPSDDPAQDG